MSGHGIRRVWDTALVGVMSALSYLLVGTLFGGNVTIEAFTIGFTGNLIFTCAIPVSKLDLDLPLIGMNHG